jgi:hypothetical protein
VTPAELAHCEGVETATLARRIGVSRRSVYLAGERGIPWASAMTGDYGRLVTVEAVADALGMTHGEAFDALRDCVALYYDRARDAHVALERARAEAEAAAMGGG